MMELKKTAYPDNKKSELSNITNYNILRFIFFY